MFLLFLVLVLLVSGPFLWLTDFSGRASRDQSGFGRVKPLDHRSPGPNKLSVDFINGVGARITNVSVSSVDSTGVVYATLTPASRYVFLGETFKAEFTELDRVCPAGADSYDIALNVTYTNAINYMNYSYIGRIWGPC